MPAPGRKPPTFTPLAAPAAPAAPVELYSQGVLTVRQAARFLGLRPRTVRELIESGELPSILHCRRRVVPRSACVARLAELHREQHKQGA